MLAAQIGENDARFGPRFPAVGPVYNPQLQQLALSTAESMGISDRMRVGTYVGVAGPSYETPHEIGAMRVLGGDAVGMSTVPEVRSSHSSVFCLPGSVQRMCMRSKAWLAASVSLRLAENVHALEGLACRKRVAPASLPAAPASRVRLRQAFSRML